MYLGYCTDLLGVGRRQLWLQETASDKQKSDASWCYGGQLENFPWLNQGGKDRK